MKAAVCHDRIDPMPMITKRIRLNDIVSGGFEELRANRNLQLRHGDARNLGASVTTPFL